MPTLRLPRSSPSILAQSETRQGVRPWVSVFHLQGQGVQRTGVTSRSATTKRGRSHAANPHLSKALTPKPEGGASSLASRGPAHPSRGIKGFTARSRSHKQSWTSEESVG